MGVGVSLSLREQERLVLERIAADPGLQQSREVQGLLRELAHLRESNPLQFWEPYPKQRGFLGSREPTKAFFGGNGSGKTACGVADDLIQLVDEGALPSHLKPFKRWEPPVFIRVAAPKMAVVESVILEKFRELAPKNQLFGGSFDKAYNKVNRKLLFANGSWVLFNTYDQDRDAWAGVELHRTHLDEEPEGEHGRGLFTESVARGRKYAPDSQIMFTMTPLFGLSWTYDEVWERRHESDVHCTVASMRDNPFIDAEATIRQLGHLSEEEMSAVVDGKFVHFHGAVLTVPDSSVVEPISPKHLEGQDVYVGIDPGIRRGGVIFVAFDRENTALAFDELYPESLTVPQIAAQIRERLSYWRVDDPQFVIDPSARNRMLTNAESVEGEFAREGIYCNPGQNDRLAGVLQMRARLQQGGLLIARNCQNLLMETRRWLVAKDEATEQQKAKIKGAGGTFATIGPDHIVDPLRYVCMERLWWSEDIAEKRQQYAWRPDVAPPSFALGRGAPANVGPMGAMS